jgi:Bacterial Ig-like domain (group 3)
VPLTVAKSGTATTLTVSAARVRYGDERAERMTVVITAQDGTVPGAKVTIKSGRTALCALTLGSGKGSCTLAAVQLRPGTYSLTVTYPGSANYAGSVSSPKTLVVIS